MNAKRLFFVLVASLTIIVIGIGAGSYIMAGMFKTKSAELASTKGRVEQLNTQQNSIAKSKQDITTYAELEGITKKIVPQDKDQAEAVRQLTKIANASNVPLTTITFPSSSLGTKVPGKATTPSAASSAAVAATPNLSQLTPVPNIPGVYNLQITLGNNSNNTVTFNQLNSFLQALENNRRTAAVASINIQPQQDNPNKLVFTLIINIYIKPS